MLSWVPGSFGIIRNRSRPVLDSVSPASLDFSRNLRYSKDVAAPLTSFSAPACIGADRDASTVVELREREARSSLSMTESKMPTKPDVALA